MLNMTPRPITVPVSVARSFSLLASRSRRLSVRCLRAASVAFAINFPGNVRAKTSDVALKRAFTGPFDWFSERICSTSSCFSRLLVANSNTLLFDALLEEFEGTRSNVLFSPRRDFRLRRLFELL